MVQQDYFMRQIDQLGRVLGKILSDIIGIKQKGQTSLDFEFAYQIFKSELDIDIDKLLTIPNNDFINILKNKKGFNNENLDKLADIFWEIADNNEQSKYICKKCLIIYEYLEKTETTYSFDRNFKIERLKNILNNFE